MENHHFVRGKLTISMATVLWGSHGFFRSFDPKGLSSLNPELRIVYAYAHRHKYTVTYIYIYYIYM
jgi:hypothetical protein